MGLCYIIKKGVNMKKIIKNAVLPLLMTAMLVSCGNVGSKYYGAVKDAVKKDYSSEVTFNSANYIKVTKINAEENDSDISYPDDVLLNFVYYKINITVSENKMDVYPAYNIEQNQAYAGINSLVYSAIYEALNLAIGSKELTIESGTI